MKNTYKYLTIILLSVFIFSACQLKEEYAVQYSFINELSTETKVEPTADGLKIETPFADFTCDVATMKGVLTRQGDTFILTLEGNETSERCSQRFLAEITGMKAGDYEIKLVYKRGSDSQQVVYEKFTVGN